MMSNPKTVVIIRFGSLWIVRRFVSPVFLSDEALQRNVPIELVESCTKVQVRV